MSVDLAVELERARADLAEVVRRAPELWEHLYAQDATAADLVKPAQTAAVHSPALFLGPGPVQKVYLDVTAEIARAHGVLGRGTDVPAFWTRAALDARPLTGQRAPTTALEEFVPWCRVLDGMLQWCQGEHKYGRLAPPEQSAVLEACAHVGSAKGHVEDLWPPARPEPEPMCVTCEQKPREREGDSLRRECSACRKARSRGKGKAA